ncbi:hypothetical protein ACH5RR_001142 [Cinchona calisaya]|uniref:Uncharacterized protein n=1 Tax=Cinchona calisaya TaxID=153742 RepID=A0ABD3B2Z8_9GENT
MDMIDGNHATTYALLPMYCVMVTNTKGPYRGILLSAIELDRNRDRFPRHTPWTFMINRRKGLIEAIRYKVPHAINRKYCVYILTNFRAKLLGSFSRKLQDLTLSKHCGSSATAGTILAIVAVAGSIPPTFTTATSILGPSTTTMLEFGCASLKIPEFVLLLEIAWKFTSSRELDGQPISTNYGLDNSRN